MRLLVAYQFVSFVYALFILSLTRYLMLASKVQTILEWSFPSSTNWKNLFFRTQHTLGGFVFNHDLGMSDWALWLPSMDGLCFDFLNRFFIHHWNWQNKLECLSLQSTFKSKSKSLIERKGHHNIFHFRRCHYHLQISDMAENFWLDKNAWQQAGVILILEFFLNSRYNQILPCSVKKSYVC